MDDILKRLGELLSAGGAGLVDYLAAHVLLCLVPAFIIAGFVSSLIPKEAITRYLGPRANKWISYPASALGGFVLAVCSCTILPLFAGIWRRGAGLGPAITFLFVGPAINILAISYTGSVIGFDIALARLVLSILFGIVIGMLVAWVFHAEETLRASNMEQTDLFEQNARVKPVILFLFTLLFAMLIVGTLQVELFTGVFAQIVLPLDADSSLLSALTSAGLSLQGALLIVLLPVIAVLGWKGFSNIHLGFNRFSVAAMLVIALTILSAAPYMETGTRVIGLNGRFVAEAVLLVGVGWISARYLTREELSGWIWETWKFAGQIVPLLLVGVFAASVVRQLIPQEWVRAIAGENTLQANLTGVAFGVFMYFPTLVEVPVARMFLDLGMARGPLLAYLLADPELSLQSILVLNQVMGRKKTTLYILLVAVFSTLAGYLFGLVIAG